MQVSARARPRLWSARLKRLLDIAVAAALLTVLSPLVAIIAAAVRLESPGPVFYRSRRAGLRGCAFDMLKFRKMAVDASGPPLTIADDPRFTRLGRFLAASKLDELPQLWNVIRGDMSLVGPRPEDFFFVARERRTYEAILEVRPGITGLSQLAFAREGELLREEDSIRFYVERVLPAKMQLDRLYIARRSLALDLKILFWTLGATLLRWNVSVDRQTGQISCRRRKRIASRPRETTLQAPAKASFGGMGVFDYSLPQLKRGKTMTRAADGVKTVILAGGMGTRLAPHTSVLPKPLLPIGNRAILEILIERLVALGFRDVVLCVGYLSHLIEAVVANPSAAARSGARIMLVQEPTPLGTAAPLRLVEGLDSTFLATNGDVLTNLDYRDLLRHHRRTDNVVTIAAKRRTTRLDYGVLHVEDSQVDPCRLIEYEEKPELTTLVSMGIYVFEPEVVDWIPQGRQYDVPDLVQALLQAGKAVGVYPYDGFWLDIGAPAEYEEALRIEKELGDEMLLGDKR